MELTIVLSNNRFHMDNAVRLISSIISPETDSQTRINYEHLILDSISYEFIQMLIKIIEDNDMTVPIKNYSITVLCRIAATNDLFCKIDNQQQVISQLYFLALSLMTNSNQFSICHLSVSLYIICAKLINNGFSSLFLSEIINGILNSKTNLSLHAFCFALQELSEELTITKRELIDIIHIIDIKLKSSINDNNFGESNELLVLIRSLLDLDDIFDMFCNDDLIEDRNELLNDIFYFIKFPEAYVNSISCFISLIENNIQTMLPFLHQIIQIIFQQFTLIKNNSNINFVYQYENPLNIIIKSSCIFLFLLSKNYHHINLLLNNNHIDPINYNEIISQLCDIASKCNPYCDSPTDWNFHIIAQNSICVLLEKYDEADLQDIANKSFPFLQSSNYGERYITLIIFGIIVSNIGQPAFIPIKDIVLSLLNDPTPRVRDASLFCLKQYIASIPNKGCRITQYEVLNEIYENVKTHICEFDQPEIVISTFDLFYTLSQISGFESCEIMKILFSNFLGLADKFIHKHINHILSMICSSHISVINSYTELENLLLTSLNNLEFWKFLPSIFEITVKFIERFGNYVPISDSLIEALIQFSHLNNEFSFYSLPLIGIIFKTFSKKDFTDILDEMNNYCISLINSSEPDLMIHSSIYFEYLLTSNLLSQETYENLLNLFLSIFTKTEELPYDLKIYIFYNIILICKKLKEIIIHNHKLLLSNFQLLLDESNLLQFGSSSLIYFFQILVKTMISLLEITPLEILKLYPNLFQAFLIFCIKLKRASKSIIGQIRKIFDFIASVFPEVFIDTLKLHPNEVHGFIYKMKDDSLEFKKLVRLILQALN